MKTILPTLLLFLLTSSFFSIQVLACSCETIAHTFEESINYRSNILLVEVDSIVPYYMHATIIGILYSSELPVVATDKIIIEGGYQGSGDANCMEELTNFTKGETLILDINHWENRYSLSGVCSTHYKRVRGSGFGWGYEAVIWNFLNSYLKPNTCNREQLRVTKQPDSTSTTMNCLLEGQWEVQAPDTILEEDLYWRSLLVATDPEAETRTVTRYSSNTINATLKVGSSYYIVSYLDGWGANVRDGFVQSETTYVEACTDGQVRIKTIPVSSSSSSFSLYGTIKTIWRNGNIDLTLQVNEKEQLLAASDLGNYTVDGERCQKYNIKPYKNDTPLAGVTAHDITWIRSHILGRSPFSVAEQYISADVNRSNSITSSDLVEIQKLILNKITHFSNNTSWRFLTTNSPIFDNRSHVPTRIAAHLLERNFEESYTIYDVYKTIHNLDFVAIKIGDVTGDAVGSLTASSEMELVLLEDEATAVTKTSFIPSNQPIVVTNYPNPFKDKTTFRYELSQAKKVVLTIFDIQGHIIQKVTTKGKVGVNELSVDLSFLQTASMLFYQLAYDDRVVTKKMIRY